MSTSTETRGAFTLASVTHDVVEVNGEPAMGLRVAGVITAVYVPTVEGGAIAALRIVRNPEKLAYISRQLAH